MCCRISKYLTGKVFCLLFQLQEHLVKKIKHSSKILFIWLSYFCSGMAYTNDSFNERLVELVSNILFSKYFTSNVIFNSQIYCNLGRLTDGNKPGFTVFMEKLLNTLLEILIYICAARSHKLAIFPSLVHSIQQFSPTDSVFYTFKIV